jgi:hypothetical protein
MPKTETAGRPIAGISGFGLLSDFDIRASDFNCAPVFALLRIASTQRAA